MLWETQSLGYMEEKGRRKAQALHTLEETSIIVWTLYTMIPRGVERHRQFCLEWRMREGMIMALVSASDLPQTETPLLRFLLGWSQWKTLLPDI